MNLGERDWQALERLRERFLQAGTASGPYWTSIDDLEAYDATYAQRIGWKWDAVLASLTRRGWKPSVDAILDWGCGSGIAGRKVLDWLGATRPGRVAVFDHSPLAMAFAATRIRRGFPDAIVAQGCPEASTLGRTLLVASHVINELPAGRLEELLEIARQCAAVIWVEPGTHQASHLLVRARQRLVPALSIVAPCCHSHACGLLQPGMEVHWCHHFAPPPHGIFADGPWVRFAQRAGIDLRSLPYSHLVLATPTSSPSPSPSTTVRLLGRPRLLKGHATFLGCDAGGIRERTVQKRDAPGLYRSFKKGWTPDWVTVDQDPSGPTRTAAWPPAGAEGMDDP